MTILVMANPLKLSVLDQSPAAGDKTQDHAIRESLALAKHCDALGYHRYWVSEHHNSESIVGTAPEVLMAAIAATTQRIRIGSAGVMLPHYSTLKVAEQFRVLEAIAPGRIDLGVGRAPGSDRADGDGAQSRPQCRGELPQPGAGTGLLVARGAVARGAPVPRNSRASPGADDPGDLDPRQLRLRRAARGALRASVCVCVFLHRGSRYRGGPLALPTQLSRQRAFTPSRRRRSASGRLPPIPRPKRGTC